MGVNTLVTITVAVIRTTKSAITTKAGKATTNNLGVTSLASHITKEVTASMEVCISIAKV